MYQQHILHLPGNIQETVCIACMLFPAAGLSLVSHMPPCDVSDVAILVGRQVQLWTADGAQIVGFFIVEERVQAGCGQVGQGQGSGEARGEGWQLNSGWEAALASLKGRLQAACAAFSDCNSLRKLKDFALLSCTALGRSDCLALATLTAIFVTAKPVMNLVMMMATRLLVLCAVVAKHLMREWLCAPRACRACGSRAGCPRTCFTFLFSPEPDAVQTCWLGS